MKRRKLYLDSCILVSFYYEKDKGHQKAIDFFEQSLKFKNTRLLCSNFTITEFALVCIKNNYLTENKVYEITNEILLTSKIGRKYSINFVNPKSNGYTFEDFFLDIQKVILETRPRPHLADVIHSIIMSQNKICKIVTDNTEHFKHILGIKPIKPEDVKSDVIK
jgi:predicted nucleic acid-binding protein